MLDNIENTCQSLAPIFIANISQRLIKNTPVFICVSQESLHKVMGKENNDDSDNQLLDLDDNNKSIFMSHNLKE